jgi:hypothetical protein
MLVGEYQAIVETPIVSVATPDVQQVFVMQDYQTPLLVHARNSGALDYSSPEIEPLQLLSIETNTEQRSFRRVLSSENLFDRLVS